MPPMTLTAIMYLTPGPLSMILNLLPCFPAPIPLILPEMANAFPATFVGYAPNVIMGGTPAVPMGSIITMTPILPFAGPAPTAAIPSGDMVGPTIPLMGFLTVLVDGRPILCCLLSMAMADVMQSTSDCPANCLSILIG